MDNIFLQKVMLLADKEGTRYPRAVANHFAQFFGGVNSALSGAFFFFLLVPVLLIF
jgi:hypothetical protein